MRGTIFGAIGARLGTADAAGLLTIDLRPGGVLRRNVVVAVLTTFSSALWIAILARVVSAIAGQPSIPLSQLLIIAMVGGALGSGLILRDHRGARRRRRPAWAGTSTRCRRRWSPRSVT